jgi:hypothetical protein
MRPKWHTQQELLIVDSDALRSLQSIVAINESNLSCAQPATGGASMRVSRAVAVASIAVLVSPALVQAAAAQEQKPSIEELM